MVKEKKEKASWISRKITSVKQKADYLWTGVWADRRGTYKVRLIKTVNLSLRTLINPDLQTRAYALTFNTLLSIVPAFALLLAIGKGFGLQDVLQNEIINIFPSQRKMSETLISLVNSYLGETTQGVFLGVGILFLFYTVITLMSEIENNFNTIWGAIDNRTMYQKLVDYLAVCLIVPLMLICSIGITIFMNNAFRTHFQIPLLSPVIDILLDLAPFFLVCLAFAFSFYWIPHAKVKVKYAAISGVICGIAFQILQMVFLNGQIMVSRYNAIYGSFAFLPLFLLWLWISWLIVLSGCVITYSAQYVFCFPFTKSVSNVSESYYTKVLVVIISIIAARHIRNEEPLSPGAISSKFTLPIRLVKKAVRHLQNAGLLYFVELPGKSQFDAGVIPAFELSDFTIADLMKRLEEFGEKDFIPGFAQTYGKVIKTVDDIKTEEYKIASETLLRDLALTIEPQLSEKSTE